jgi:2,3-bisphosphoglycerate-independent phosphoglycerate mutase
VGKAEYALSALEACDVVYIHVEAPDEASHEGKLEDKIKAIENFDALVVGTVMRGIKELGDYRVLVMPDHATPLEARTHTQDPVPFVIFDGVRKGNGAGSGYSEAIATLKHRVEIKDAHRLMGYFIRGEFE